VRGLHPLQAAHGRGPAPTRNEHQRQPNLKT